MVPLIVPISALLIGVALLLSGTGLLNTLLALRGGIEGYTGATLGIVMSGYFVGFLIGTYLALPLIRRIGHIRTFAFCAASIASLVLIHALWVSPIGWFILRVLTGTALVILYTVIESWLNSKTPGESRGKVFAVYMTVNLTSLAASQQLLRFDHTAGFTLFAVASMFICLSLMPVTWTRFPQPEVHRVEHVRLSVLSKAAPVAIWAAFLSGLAMGAFWGLGAVFASKIGLGADSVAMFITATILGGAIFQLPLGRYSDKIDRKKMIVIVAGVATVLAISAIFIVEHLLLLLGVMGLYGGFAFAVYPIAIAHLVDNLAQEQMLAGGSSLLLLHGLGAVVGPILGGQLITFFGATSLPMFWAAMFGVLALIAALYKDRNPDIPEDHNADFVPMLRTTPTAFEMLPPEEKSDEGDDQYEPVWGHAEENASATNPENDTK